MSLEPFSPSNHHHHHHYVIVTRKSLLASQPRRPTWFCRTTRSRGSALLDFSTGGEGPSSSSWEGGQLVGAKSQLFSENLKWWAPLIDYYLHRLPNLATLIVIIIVVILIIVIIIYDHFYRLPNLATLDMSRNKIVEIEQGAFEGAYSIDEMWVFVCICLCTWIWGNA